MRSSVKIEYCKQPLKMNLFPFLIVFIALYFSGCATTMKHPQASYMNGNWKKAIAESHSWLVSNPNDTTVLEILGISAIKIGDSLTAVETLRPFAFSTTDNELREMILEASIATGRLALARSMITHKSTITPDDPTLDKQFANVEKRIHDAHVADTKGDKAMETKDWATAASSFRSASKNYAGKDIYRAKLHLAQAEILVSKAGAAKSESAFKHIDDSIALWPDSPLTYWIKGDVSMKLGQDDLAREAFQKSLDLGIGSPYKMQARAVVNSGK
jgi:Flp pilus assembly protein TadD